MFFAKYSLQIKHNYIYSRGNSVPIFDFLENYIVHENYICKIRLLTKILAKVSLGAKPSLTCKIQHSLKSAAFENSLIGFSIHHFYYQLLCPLSSKT